MGAAKSIASGNSRIGRKKVMVSSARAGVAAY
jgi:hypothetical protein